MVASEMHKIFTKEKERLIRCNQLKMDELKVEEQGLRSKLVRIKDKAEQVFRGDYDLDNYRRVIQDIYNKVRELRLTNHVHATAVTSIIIILMLHCYCFHSLESFVGVR